MKDPVSYNGRPVPDPTVLTTQQLIREISALREIIEARLNGNDAAVSLLRGTTDRFPHVVKEAICELQKVHEEKFRGVERQFIDRDKALEAAFQAAKEAVGKSEVSTVKQLDQVANQLGTIEKSLDDKITDIKERISTVDNRSSMGATAITSRTIGRSEVWGFIVGAAGLIFALTTIISMLPHVFK